MRTDPHDASKRENHEGVDIRVPSGTPVYAVNKGKVIVSANQGERPGENGKTTGYGGFVYIKHSNNFISVYGHLRSRLVNVNDIVEAGEQIGISGGETNDPHHGSSTGPHLHFQLEDESQTPYPRVLDSLIQKANVHGSSDNVQLEVISAKRRTLTANGKIGTPNNPTGADLDNERIQVEANIEAVGLRRAEVTAKFGSNVLTLTELNRGDMISRITLDGYNNVIKPNNFVSPWPTTTSVVVEIMGIAGISVSDGFFVDRIPFTFEQHGVFQVVEVTDEVSPTGWRTKVRGYFKMLWYDANGQSTAIF